MSHGQKLLNHDPIAFALAAAAALVALAAVALMTVSASGAAVPTAVQASLAP